MHLEVKEAKKVSSPARANVRLLCWLLTDPNDLGKRVIHVKNTWAKRCDVMLYMSSQENKTFPTVGLKVLPGRAHIASKSKAAWRYIHQHYLHQADFFVKADPDTYIVVENMKKFLEDKDPEKAEFFGHKMTLPVTNVSYISGGPGILLSRGSVKLLMEAFNRTKDCMPDGTGTCFKPLKMIK